MVALALIYHQFLGNLPILYDGVIGPFDAFESIFLGAFLHNLFQIFAVVYEEAKCFIEFDVEGIGEDYAHKLERVFCFIYGFFGEELSGIDEEMAFSLFLFWLNVWGAILIHEILKNFGNDGFGNAHDFAFLSFQDWESDLGEDRSTIIDRSTEWFTNSMKFWVLLSFSLWGVAFGRDGKFEWLFVAPDRLKIHFRGRFARRRAPPPRHSQPKNRWVWLWISLTIWTISRFSSWLRLAYYQFITYIISLSQFINCIFIIVKKFYGSGPTYSLPVSASCTAWSFQPWDPSGTLR